MFNLLKQSFPISQKEYPCDAYRDIITTVPEEKLKELKVYDKLKKKINKGEKYLYRVANDNGEFKTKRISIENYEIIRNELYEFF